jgi:mannose-6-phosphate isomerase-like protein (cupin superfamily)
MSEVRDTGVVVVQPDEGESFWQPVPANGYAEVRVSHRRHPAIRSFATGIQVIAPGCHIREHVHPRQQELLFFFEGQGEAVIDGRSYPLQPGTTVYVGAGHRSRGGPEHGRTRD